MRRMYMNVARPVGQFIQPFRTQSCGLTQLRRAISTDPYISNREERRGQGQDDKSTKKAGEDWKEGKAGEEWRQDKIGEDKGSENVEGFQAERTRDQTDKARLDNEKGGLNSYATREQAARDQARSVQEGGSFGMSNDRAKDNNPSEMKSKSNDRASDSWMNDKSRDSSTFGKNDDSARNDKSRDSSTFGKNDDSASATRDRAKDELNASSGMSSDKSRNYSSSADRGQTATQSAKTSATDAFETAKDKAASMAQSAKDTASSAAKSAKDTASSAAQSIKETAGDAKDKAAELGRQASGKIQEKAGDAKEYFDKKKDEKR